MMMICYVLANCIEVPNPNDAAEPLQCCNRAGQIGSGGLFFLFFFSLSLMMITRSSSLLVSDHGTVLVLSLFVLDLNLCAAKIYSPWLWASLPGARNAVLLDILCSRVA